MLTQEALDSPSVHAAQQMLVRYVMERRFHRKSAPLFVAR